MCGVPSNSRSTDTDADTDADMWENSPAKKWKKISQCCHKQRPNDTLALQITLLKS